MKNAHERFGTLEFTKRVKETTTRIRVHVDRLIAEPAKEGHGPASAHLLSVLGSDAEIAALWAAVTEGAFFQIRLPGRPAFAASLGPEAQCFRGSVSIQGRNRPVRHLVALSADLVKTRPGADRDGKRTLLFDGDPAFVLYRVSRRFGLPVVPEWASWFVRELNQRKAITPLLGLGCSPVLIKGNKQTFLKWIGRALRERLIRIPEENVSISWELRHSAGYALPEARTGTNTSCVRSLSQRNSFQSSSRSTRPVSRTRGIQRRSSPSLGMRRRAALTF